MKHWLASAALLVASGCPSVGRDSGETQGKLPPLDGPTVEFDPANSIIPFPNNLVINPATGKVNIPAPACETPAAKALRVGVLNTLDGFGTYEAGMQVTFTDDVDMASVQGHVVMYERTKMGAAVTGGQAIPVVLIPSTALRFDAANCTAPPAAIHALTIVPMIPLDQKSTYTVALTDGITTSAGTPYIPSGTWALVRQSTDPVTLKDGCDYSNPTSCTVLAEKTPLDPAGDANHNGVPDLVELVGLDQLWKAHATGLAFLDAATGSSDRSKILVAWEVTTQTTTDPLDTDVAGSPASSIPEQTFPQAPASVVPGTATPRQFIDAVYVKIGVAANIGAADQICQQIGCDSVGDVLGAGLPLVNFQTHVPNAYSGTADVPGAWSDPVHPAVQDPFTVPSVGVPGVIPVLAFVPQCPNPSCTGTTFNTPPANGWPIIVFGHGLGSQKESLFVIAPQLAKAGFATVAIDFVDHGSRAVRTTADLALGCNGTCSTTTGTTCGHDSDCPSTETCNLPAFGFDTLQCFAPFLSTDLAATRDNIRQTVLDLNRLTHAVKACGTTACGTTFKVDPAHVLYTGMSLGAIIGSTTSAIDADIKMSVLNVDGAGWVDIFENTANLTIRCGVVDGLIAAGVVQGAPWNGSTDPATATGLCTTDAWKTMPGYQQFSGIARWILDPADGANFAARLAPKRFLLQEVVDDEVVPNIATDRFGALTGLTPAAADAYAPNNPGVPNGASAALLGTSPPTSAMKNTWLRYTTLPQSDAGTGGFGNAYHHASLLQPAAVVGHCVAASSMPCTADTQCSAGGGNVCVFPGTLGTARMQTDAITYLLFNK